jgi:uncharacterized membrane protein
MARRIVTTEETAATDDVREERSVRDDRHVYKLEDIAWFIIALIMVLILVRFVLLLLGARTGVPFVDFWYNITAPLIAPFAGIFGTTGTYNSYTGMRIEPESLVAMLVYGLVGYLIVLAIRLLKRNPERRP